MWTFGCGFVIICLSDFPDSELLFWIKDSDNSFLNIVFSVTFIEILTVTKFSGLRNWIADIGLVSTVTSVSLKCLPTVCCMLCLCHVVSVSLPLPIVSSNYVEDTDTGFSHLNSVAILESLSHLPIPQCLLIHPAIPNTHLCYRDFLLVSAHLLKPTCKHLHYLILTCKPCVHLKYTHL